LTDEEEQEEFNRKADAAVPRAIGCCLLGLLNAFALILVPVPVLLMLNR
jgi:hypothetical protein